MNPSTPTPTATTPAQPTPTKNILQSKTFWFNVLTLAATVSGYLPAKYAAIILPFANMGLRLLTNQGTTILPQG